MTQTVVEIHGVTPRQIDFWVRMDYLRPVNPTPGSGRTREWPEKEIRVARMMARLVAAGFAPAAASEHARSVLREQGWPVRLQLRGGVVLEVADEETT